MYLTLIHITDVANAQMQVGPFEDYPTAAEAGIEFVRLLSEESDWLRDNATYNVVPVPEDPVSVEDGVAEFLNETIVAPDGTIGGWAEVVSL